MARIAGTDLPRDKQVEVGLTYVFGIGRSTSRNILQTLDIDLTTKVRDLTDRPFGGSQAAIVQTDFDFTVLPGVRPTVFIEILRDDGQIGDISINTSPLVLL